MNDSKSILAGPPPFWRDRFLAMYRRCGWRGFTRFYDLLKPPAGRRELQAVTRYGSHFILTPWDSVDSHVIDEGFYESEVLEAIRPALAETDAVLWVVGANFGLHAITAKFLYPAIRVVAFEPSPAMGARILENCELNRVSLDLHAYALSDSEGLLPFYANASGNPGMSTLHPCDGFAYDHRFHIAAHTAEQVILRGLAPAPTALLIDAEGAEEAILRGFGHHLSAPSLRRLVLEAPNDFLQSGSPMKLLELAHDAGFKFEKLERKENTAHALSNFLGVRPSTP